MVAETQNRPAGSVDDRLFSRDAPGLGSFAVRPLCPDEDARLIHGWVTRPYARFWGMGGATVEEVRNSYREIVSPPRSNAYVGLYQGEPAFLLEWYLPIHDRLADYYPVERGDQGMHILVAPPQQRIRGFTWQVFRTVMEFLFTDPSCERVVVEPDVRNDRIHRLNERAGFVYHRVIELPEKQAYLATCTRRQYENATRQE